MALATTTLSAAVALNDVSIVIASATSISASARKAVTGTSDDVTEWIFICCRLLRATKRVDDWTQPIPNFA
jgi:hypothetical protein